MDNSSLFNQYFFEKEFDPPYQRNEYWLGLFEKMAKEIAREINPGTVLDAGCAMGFLVEALRKKKVNAYGVDISKYAISQAHENLRPLLRMGSLTDPFPQRYDLIIARNVFEYLSKSQAIKAIKNLTKYSDDIIFSSSPQDFKITAPLNVHPQEYWLELFAKHNFYRDMNFDASFISPWAVRVRKSREPVHRIIRSYEQRHTFLLQENQDLRSALIDLRLENERTLENNDTLIENIHALTKMIHDWDDHWNNLKNSRGWRFVEKVRKIVLVFIPENSKRRRLLMKMLKGKNTSDLSVVQLPSIDLAESQKVLSALEKPMVSIVKSDLRIALYTTDSWVTASAYLRFTAPSLYSNAGFELLDGMQSGGALRFHDDCDLVVIHRDFPRHKAKYDSVVNWANKNKKPVVYEIDDLLLEIPKIHPEYKYYAGCAKDIIKAIKSAAGVVCSTVELSDYLRRYNNNVWVIPNYIPERMWEFPKPLAREKSREIVIGYMGGMTHGPDLELITPCLQRILRDYKERVTMRFWGFVPRDLEDHPNVECFKQLLPDYTAFVPYFQKQSADIFVSPLRQNVFNTCKSPIKYLEYSAKGIPGVYSRIAPYENTITHGYNGFLAASEAEWESLLRELITNESLRLRIGSAAQKTILHEHLLKDHLMEWGTVYRAAAQRRY